MPSSKALAKAIFEKSYVKGDQKEVMAMLVRASDAGRADERRRILKALDDQHDLLTQKRNEVSREDRKERFRLTQSIRTISAMIKLLSDR